MMQTNDEFIICDGGGLTLNAAAYRVIGLMNKSSDVAVELKDKVGQAYGSELLTKMCLDHCKRMCNDRPQVYRGGFQNMCDAVGKTEAHFDREIKEDFDAFKESRQGAYRKLTFKGSEVGTGHSLEFDFMITRYRSCDYPCNCC